MICKRCDANVDIDEHHILCKFMDNKKGLGGKVNLCRNKCHIPLHVIISSLLWKHIKPENKEAATQEVIRFTESWIKNYHKKDLTPQKTFDDINERNREDYENGMVRCKNCDMEIDIEDEYCDYCSAVQLKD